MLISYIRCVIEQVCAIFGFITNISDKRSIKAKAKYSPFNMRKSIELCIPKNIIVNVF